jgi:hypothetical protein
MKRVRIQSFLVMALVIVVGGILLFQNAKLSGHSQNPQGHLKPASTKHKGKQLLRVEQSTTESRDTASATPESLETNFQPETKSSASVEEIIKMVSKDPISAISQAEMLLPEERLNALKGIMAAWAKVDGTGCYNWVMASKASNEKTSLFIIAMASIADPQLLFSLIDSTPKGVLKDEAIFYMFQDLAAFDMGRALVLTRDLSSENSAKGTAEKLGRIGGRNGIGGISKMLEDIPYGYFRDYFISSAIESAGKSDPVKALEWVLADPKLCNSDSIGSLSTAFAMNRPIEGLELAAGIKDLKLRNLFIQSLGATWAYNKPEEAGAWLVSRISETDFSSNETVAHDIMHKWIRSDPEKALSQINSIPDLLARDQAMVAALEAYSTFDPEAAAAKLAPFLTNDSKENQVAISEITNNWLRRDPLEASAWIARMKSGTLKDVSIGQLVSNIISKDQDYQMANSWALQIRSNEKRAEVIGKIKNHMNRFLPK